MNKSHSDYPFDLGTHCPAFVVTNDEAAAWFATGLSWLYGFNHEEAIGCFRNATQADDGFALAWWGIAISSGPFMNKPWGWLTMPEKEQALAACYVAVGEAMSRAATAPPEARALIEALAVRYPQTEVPDDGVLASWERAYADAMIPVFEAFGDDPNIAALYIDPQIMLTPWQIYDVDKCAPNPEAREREIQAALERSLAGADHIGVRRFDIHVQEISPTLEKALPSARQLQELPPSNAGHLQHMPSHIHALVGDFDEATRCSRLSMATEKRFMANLHRSPFYCTLACHDVHILMFAGMQTGNLADAADAAIVMAEILENVLAHPPVTHMDMTLKGYYATIAHVDVRFGRWQQIAGREFTGDPASMPVSHAMHHQARAVALAALDRHDQADMAAADFDAVRACVPAGYAYFNNQADDILAVGDAMMRGEMAYHAGDIEAEFDWLREAVAAEDRLVYTEPRAWMHPPRHALGALLLEQRRIDEARVIYGRDLGHDEELPVSRQNRGNVWSLSGLSEYFEKLEDPRAGDAGAMFAEALPLADQPVTSSCFCRSRAGGSATS